MAVILIVDDESAQRNIMASILRSAGHAVFEAGNVDAALVQLGDTNPEVVLTDLKMEGKSGIVLVEEVAKRKSPPEIVVITAFGSIETAVKAMKSGAYDYLNKPIEREELLLVVERASEKYLLRQEGVLLRAELTRQITNGLIAESMSMKSIIEIVKKVAQSDSTVLIRGESGTGKERIASLIHYLSNRGRKPMQAINCAAFRKLSSKVNCLVTKKEPLQERKTFTRGFLKLHRAALCFWMRLATCLLPRRQSCYVLSRKGK
jgi:two-component system response regulator AtoC